MTFTENDKLKAMAIVNIFETSRPFGDYAACAVLDDGAGYRIRRRSDGSVLPADFAAEEVRPERKRQGLWWY